MIHNEICPRCGKLLILQTTTPPYNCYYCGNSFSLVIESTVKIQEKEEINLRPILPVLKEGEVVQLTNEQHPWNKELGLICDRKHKYYRLEIRGKKIWIPEHWVGELND
jgi:hypothetical protein